MQQHLLPFSLNNNGYAIVGRVSFEIENKYGIERVKMTRSRIYLKYQMIRAHDGVTQLLNEESESINANKWSFYSFLNTEILEYVEKSLVNIF